MGMKEGKNQVSSLRNIRIADEIRGVLRTNRKK